MELEKVKQTYDKWAPFYNPTHRWGLPKRHTAREALQLNKGDRVLDVACGTGLNFPEICEKIGSEGRLVGSDLSPRMLNIARNLIRDHDWKNVEVVEADAARLPFPDSSFDKVICTYALNIIPDYVQALKEIHRVLVPGGRFVSLEVGSGHSMPSWMAPICAVDLGHEALDAIKNVFADVKVESFWQGMVFMAVAVSSNSKKQIDL